MRTRAALTVGLIALLVGCESSSPTEVASSVAGSWALQEPTPGSALAMTITAHGVTLTGTGTFAGEAGPSGIVQLTGTVAGTTIVLDFVLQTTNPSPGTTNEAHFIGHRVGARLVGTLLYGPKAGPGSPAPATFVKD